MPPFERFRRPSAGELSHDDLMRRYKEALNLIASDHDRTSEQIASEHAENLNSWLDYVPEKKPEAKFENMISTPGEEVQKDTNYTAKSADTLFDASSKDFFGILSPEDKHIFNDVLTKARRHGAGHFYTSGALSAASSYEAREAMKAALDKQVWEEAKAKAQKHGAGHFYTTGVLNAASSFDAREAMKAGLDKQVWQEVQAKAKRHGAGHFYTSGALNAASTHNAREAMKAGLDKQVWDDVKIKAKQHGIGHFYTTGALTAASSRIAREAMLNLASKDAKTERAQSYGDFFQGEYGIPNFEDILRERGFDPRSFGRQTPPRSGTGRQQRQRPTGEDYWPPREAPRAPQPDEEIEQIIRVAVSRGNGTKWLLNEDRLVIKRVVNTVRTIRQKAAEQEREITDREIYIRYRRVFDQPEGETKKELLRSFQVLQALMGGGPNGKLPF